MVSQIPSQVAITTTPRSRFGFLQKRTQGTSIWMSILSSTIVHHVLEYITLKQRRAQRQLSSRIHEEAQSPTRAGEKPSVFNLVRLSTTSITCSQGLAIWCYFLHTFRMQFRDQATA